MPVRFSVTVVTNARTQTPRMHASWIPVLHWNDAGADVVFADNFPEMPRDGYQKLVEELATLGRPSEHAAYWEEVSIMPMFDGYSIVGSFHGETAAVNKSCELIESEIDHLFSDLPHNDG
jgi:hypothetical protein